MKNMLFLCQQSQQAKMLSEYTKNTFDFNVFPEEESFTNYSTLARIIANPLYPEIRRENATNKLKGNVQSHGIDLMYVDYDLSLAENAKNGIYLLKRLESKGLCIPAIVNIDLSVEGLPYNELSTLKSPNAMMISDRSIVSSMIEPLGKSIEELLYMMQ